MAIADPVPSTYDVPLTDEPRPNAVLATLRNARDRYASGPRRGGYMNSVTGENCAIGAVYAADGIAARAWPGNRMRLETFLSETAIEAIRRLDESAGRLFPHVRRFSDTREGGRIEAVNERSGDGYVAKVLACFDDAIEREKALVG